MNNPLYLKCSKVIEKIENEKTSFKNALYHFTNSDDKYFKKVYCITIELNKQIDMVNKIFNFYDLVEIESSGVSSYLFKVLLYEEFLSKHKKLKIGGILHLATDWMDYAYQMMEVLSNTPSWSNVAGVGLFAPRPLTRPMTKFEQRGIRLGHQTWDLIFKRFYNESLSGS